MVGNGGFRGTWNLRFWKILPSLRTLNHEAERTQVGPAQTTKPRRHKPLIVNVSVEGPFKEEEEGTTIASEVVKMEGKDPDFPDYLKGDRVRGYAAKFNCGFVPLGSLLKKSRDYTMI